MEPDAAAAAVRTPKVIELAIEETTEYELTWRVQLTTPISLSAIEYLPIPKTQLIQPAPVAKSRPIAKVLPAIRQRKCSDTEENYIKGDTLIESDKPFVLEEVNSDLTSEKTLAKTLQEEKEEEKQEEEEEEEEAREKGGEESNLDLNSNSFKLNETSTLLTENLSIQEASNLNNKDYSSSKLDHKVPSERQNNITCSLNPNEKQTKVGVDPCTRHRDWIRNKVFPKETKKNFLCCSAKKMECVNGEGCHQEDQEFQKDKETCITHCLHEFLKGLHLTHLVDYFKVLGCTCVRDLRLLEMSELEVIQLISRRRLIQQLDSLSLHHEAPPEDCSLEAWLTWYGLTHISGFLTAIGVHCVGDLSYLKEEDIQLLKPVTRRRILTCHRKNGDKGRLMQNGLIRNDYLM